MRGRVGECSWNATWERKHEERQGCMNVWERRLSAETPADDAHSPPSQWRKKRDAQTCSACVWVGWWVVSAVRPPQARKKFCRNHDNELSATIAKSNMRWLQGPLWYVVHGSATSALLSVHTRAHTHTQEEEDKRL